MGHTSVRSSRLRHLLRLAAVVSLVSMIGGYVGIASAATPGTQLWASRYNGSANSADLAYSVAVSPDGTKVFVTGSSVFILINSEDYATFAYDASTGAQLWTSRYNGPDNTVDVATSLAVSPDGTKVFVTGYSTGSGSDWDYATIAYDASTGAKLWAKRYNGPGNNFDNATDVGVSPDGSKVFVTGYSADTTGYSTDYATVAYDASTGAKLWARLYDGPGFIGDGSPSSDSATSLAVSPDGTKVFVTGTSQGSTGDPQYAWDYMTLAYNASTGAKLWAKRYNGPGNSIDGAISVAVSPDGAKVVVTGYSYGSTSWDSSDRMTFAYNASTGATLWARRYNGPANSADSASSLAVSPDGTKVFVTGSSTGSTSGYDYMTIAYDATTGATLWARRYNGPANSIDVASSLAVSPDGTKVFVTGYSDRYANDNPDYATFAYNASTGAQLWARRYNGPANGGDAALSVAVSPDGTKVFVTGYSVGSTDIYGDYATIAYAA